MPGTPHPSPNPPAQKSSSCPSMIHRRSPASSSFVLAAARLRALQLDPGPRDGGQTGSYQEEQTTSQPKPGGASGHQVRPPHPLDSRGPHGCGSAGALTARDRDCPPVAPPFGHVAGTPAARYLLVRGVGSDWAGTAGDLVLVAAGLVAAVGGHTRRTDLTSAMRP